MYLEIDGKLQAPRLINDDIIAINKPYGLASQVKSCKVANLSPFFLNLRRIVIPMVEGSVDGKRRMVLRPDTAENEDVKLVMKKSSIETHEAITNYKILKSKNTTALLECRPETGVKHQIRVHLAWGLGTPILGDHKYTYINKIVPQKLTSEMLQRLGIRQSKARYVPMHLHAKSILIPEFMNGQNLSVSCRLPPHFEENMKRLKLKP
ncbi:hypothetical protein KUTeg_010050 [Tegillarca granosa]|uniref:Pseudouridylate synthase RPUSD4, mitochondrial n=1 Tax=Tegillarca granosa TaxID=220873 RepID=A0ABQ9F8L4_TEGGR|nr:hypothetical protein KUTeg_010050 [Tegillarca granosa]